MEKQKGLAIITGASQGIGAVIAAGLATDGYRVVLVARNKQNLEKTHDEIMTTGQEYTRTCRIAARHYRLHES